jgi:hypothetical protein
MTEAEWLRATDPVPMLGVVRDGATERKMRLFALSCCRHASEADLFAIYHAAMTLEYVSRGCWGGLTSKASAAIGFDSLFRSGNPDLERIAVPWRSNVRDDRYWEKDATAEVRS